MCIAIPAQVVEIVPERPEFARVSIDGTVREVSLALLDGDPPRPGEWLVIQLGLALDRMSETEAQDAVKLLQVLGGGDEALLDDLEWLVRPAEAGG